MSVNLRINYGVSSQGKLLGFWNEPGIHIGEDYYDMDNRCEGCVGNEVYYLKKGDEDEEDF